MRLIPCIIYIIFFISGQVFGQKDKCQKSTEGKEFWFGFMEGRNYQKSPLDPVYNVPHYCEITLSSSYTCNYQIYIGNSAIAAYKGVVTPNIPVKVWIDWLLVEATGSEEVQAKAIHLTSDNPVNVYALNWSDASSEVALIFPKESLGNSYYAMCYTPHINMNGINYGSGRNSEFMIVASEDSTTVTITPTKITDKLKPANVPFKVILNKGELYQVQSENLPGTGAKGQGDLTGSYVVGDKPIAFYSGSLSTTVPYGSTVQAWDHLYEQIPPVQTWGRKFIAVPLSTRHEDTYRILAAENNTTVRIGNKPTVTLQKGVYYEFSLLYTEPSLIESDKPILLAQFSNSKTVDSYWTGGNGDPFMVIVSPINQTREKVSFVAYDSPLIKSKFFINIVVNNNAIEKIKLDGTIVIFTTLANTGYSYAQVSLTKGNHYIESTEAGSGFIAYVYGFGGVEAYGYGVGYNLDIVLDLGSNINADGNKLLIRCEGDQPLTLSAGNAFDTYKWNTGATNSEIKISDAGWYKVEVATSGGCALKDSVELQISKPIVDLGIDQIVCTPLKDTLDAGNQFAGYLWSTLETSQKIIVSKSDKYSVIATNKYGCNARDSLMVTFKDKPKIDFTKLDTLICGKKTANPIVSADKGIFSFQRLNDGFTFSGAEISVPEFGTFPFKIKATDEFSCFSDSVIHFGFHEAPVVDIGLDRTICNPDTVVLDASDRFKSYLWSTSQTDRKVTIKNTGLYSVVATNIFGCKANDGINLSFVDKPKIDFSRLDTLICGKKSTILNVSSDKGNILSQRLTDGFSFTGTNVSVPDFGSYQFKIKATDEFSCYSDSVIHFGFHKTPTIGFSVDSTKCQGYSLDTKYLGDANIPASDFAWIFGGDTIVHGKGIDAYVVPLGVNRSKRDLKLTVTDQGCPNSKLITDIKVTPTLQIGVENNLGCEPFTTKLIANNTETVRYDWNFGDGSILGGPSAQPSHTYQNAGYYAVKLKITTDKGCTNQVEIDSMIHVAPIPTARFTQLPAQCLEIGNHQISYAGTGDLQATYNWDLSAFDQEEIVADPGKTQGPFVFNLKNKPQSTIKLKVVSKYGCISTEATQLVKRKPDFEINPSSVVGCIPFVPVLAAVLSDKVDQVNFNWNFGDGSTGSGTSLSHTYKLPGKTYNLTLSGISSTTGCSNILMINDLLSTYPKPTIGFTELPAECLEPGQHDISYTGTGDQLDFYKWNLSQFDPVEIVTNPGLTQGPFVFDLKNKPQANIGLRVTSKYGCFSDTAVLLVKRKPDLTISSSIIAACTPFSTKLTGSTTDPVDQVSFSWDFGDGKSGSNVLIDHEYNTPGQIYDIGLTALSSLTGCSNTIIGKGLIRAYPKPTASFVMDHTIVYNDLPDVAFTDKSIGAKDYFWEFGDNTTSVLQNPLHHFVKMGHLKVLLEVANEYQCTDTTSQNVLVAFDRLFPPNAFSPNSPKPVDREFRLGSEGMNTEGYYFRIINRWNDIVFEARNEMKGWNGQMSNGSYAQPGVYLWLLEYTDFLGRHHKQTGTVTLIY
ncbi:MAG: PKD domain-containing protein [Mariniphaga sp.]